MPGLLYYPALFLLCLGAAHFNKSTTPKQQPKSYTVTLPLDQWQKYSDGLEVLKEQLEKSDLPSRDVKFMRDSIIVAFQSIIGTQVSQQLQAEQKPKQDTTKPKK